MALSGNDGPHSHDGVMRVLVVEDDEKDFVLTRDTFAEIPGASFCVERVSTYEAGLEGIARKAHDLFLIDYQLGDQTALELLKMSQAMECEPVIVMLTGQEDREIDLQAIRSGASDYVIKSTLSAAGLDRTIRYAMERKRLRLERDHLTSQLLQTSRRVGMADVASSVLHNVGNVLNSINISAGVVASTVRHSSLTNVARTAAMLEDHASDVGEFLTHDSKGKLIPQYLTALGKQLNLERTTLLQEIEQLVQNVEHIKQIITAQQSLARTRGIVERTMVVELIEQAVALAFSPSDYERITIIRRYQDLPPLQMDKHQVLQILINLIRNAIEAMKANSEDSSILTVGLEFKEKETSIVKIIVTDTGAGIVPDHLSRMFQQGFTTKEDGHGFGLHSAALSAKAMDGDLSVHSDGEGTGATFTLELPYQTEGVLV